MLFLASCNYPGKFNMYIEVITVIYDFCLRPPPTQFQELKIL